MLANSALLNFGGRALYEAFVGGAPCSPLTSPSLPGSRVRIHWRARRVLFPLRAGCKAAFVGMLQYSAYRVSPRIRWTSRWSTLTSFLDRVPQPAGFVVRRHARSWYAVLSSFDVPSLLRQAVAWRSWLLPRPRGAREPRRACHFRRWPGVSCSCGRGLGGRTRTRHFETSPVFRHLGAQQVSSANCQPFNLHDRAGGDRELARFRDGARCRRLAPHQADVGRMLMHRAEVAAPSTAADTPSPSCSGAPPRARPVATLDVVRRGSRRRTWRSWLRGSEAKAKRRGEENPGVVTVRQRRAVRDGVVTIQRRRRACGEPGTIPTRSCARPNQASVAPRKPLHRVLA